MYIYPYTYTKHTPVSVSLCMAHASLSLCVCTCEQESSRKKLLELQEAFEALAHKASDAKTRAQAAATREHKGTTTT